MLWSMCVTSILEHDAVKHVCHLHLGAWCCEACVSPPSWSVMLWSMCVTSILERDALKHVCHLPLVAWCCEACVSPPSWSVMLWRCYCCCFIVGVLAAGWDDSSCSRGDVLAAPSCILGPTDTGGDERGPRLHSSPALVHPSAGCCSAQGCAVQGEGHLWMCSVFLCELCVDRIISMYLWRWHFIVWSIMQLLMACHVLVDDVVLCNCWWYTYWWCLISLLMVCHASVVDVNVDVSHNCHWYVM